MLRGIVVDLGKLWLTLAAVATVVLIRLVLGRLIRAITGAHPRNRAVFWTDQAISLAALVSVLVACVAIWVDDPAR